MNSSQFANDPYAHSMLMSDYKQTIPFSDYSNRGAPKQLFYSPQLQERLAQNTQFQYSIQPSEVSNRMGSTNSSNVFKQQWKPVNRPKSASYKTTKHATKKQTTAYNRQKSAAKESLHHRNSQVLAGTGQSGRNYFEILSSQLKSKFGELLLLVSDEEQAIEQQRQTLALIDIFETYSCFTRIDRANQQCLTSRDIVTFLRENQKGGTSLSEFEVNYVVKYFDSTFQGSLNFNDFMQIILPCDNQLLRTQATQQRQAVRTLPHEYLRGDVENELATLLEKEICFHLKLEQMKLDLTSIADFKLSRIFKMLDVNKKRFIDPNGIKRYLQRMGHTVLPQEIKAIVRRLDIDGDSKITYQEFVESVSPVSPDFIPPEAIQQDRGPQFLDQSSFQANRPSIEQRSQLDTQNSKIQDTSYYYKKSRGYENISPNQSQGRNKKSNKKQQRGPHQDTTQFNQNSAANMKTSFLRGSQQSLNESQQNSQATPTSILRGSQELQSMNSRNSQRNSQEFQQRVHTVSGENINIQTRPYVQKEVAPSFGNTDQKAFDDERLKQTAPLRQVEFLTERTEIKQERKNKPFSQIQKDLGQLFQNQIFMEKQSEKIKCELARKSDFNLFQIFKHFDQNENGTIIFDEFLHCITQITMKQFNRVLKDQSLLIFMRYDNDQDLALNYTEFCQIFVPHSDQQLQDTLIGRRPSEYGTDMILREETQDIFCRLLKAHLDLEQSHEYLRQNLKRKMKEQSWTMKDMFDALDQDGKNYISILDFQTVLGQRVNTTQDIEYLLRMYDKIGDRRITFENFSREISVKNIE